MVITTAQAAASPVIVRLGWRHLLLAPLTLRDVGTLERAGLVQTDTRHGVSLLAWLSLRRFQPRLGRLRVAVWCLVPWWRRRLLRLVIRLNPHHFRLAVGGRVGAQTSNADASDIFAVMAELHGWDPETVASLTEEQLLMDLDAKAHSTKVRFGTLAEAEAFRTSLSRN